MNSKKFIFIIGIVIAFLLAVHPGFASDELKASDNGKLINGQEYVKNRVLVKFSEDETPTAETTESSARGRIPGRNARHNQLATVLSHRYRSEIKGVRYHKYTGYYMVETQENCDIAALCRKLRLEPFVIDASPDYYAVIDSTVPTGYESSKPVLAASCPASTAPGTAIYPDDEYFQYQYALYNTGQVYLPETGLSGTTGSDIKAPAGWAWTTGSEDMIIAVIDSGVSGDHEDLAGKVIQGYNFVNDTPDASDDHGHGTFAASIAAANTNNGVGIAGVCWHARIMPLKTMAASGYGSYSNIAAGIRYAAEHGAHVINLSVGGRNPSPVLEDACKYAYEQGVVLVCSAGNYSPNVHYPAAYDDYCLAVAATGADDQHAPFSNTGPEVDVAAPGYFVWGARFSPYEPDNLSSYRWDSGTSFACPYAAGAAALLISYKPFLTNAQIMSLIKYTADDVNQDEDPGVDEFLGYGRLNLRTLLEPYELN
ncbi:MAG: S8 family serine peptidase [Candidatus Aminicenantes bacterium]|nr:S8 family serine peptidase [Candidatus Aminicenantes bacterium]NIM79757.1 S8 family serine peptidase [Candidatus Aminicenantes bacterium]NIN19089.1 S8 family serine peptidase [Candidatus Aminicenantes bacterium]NIN42991.1 S8 family serine peptidase [Candidatus Aminicenantes bacterium]NIN85734.1 S8 family serine peptidase [Candidatus Aminicenantes bacterium]